MRPLPPPLPSGPFSVPRARALGVTPAMLRRASLDRTFRGMRSPHPPADVLERCRAYAVLLPPGHAFSHVTAAVLHGVPLPRRLAERRALDVVVPAPSRAPQRDGVVGHKVEPERTRIVCAHGLPVTSAASTWALLATVLEVPDLVAAADHLLTVGLASREELRRELRPGARHVRRARIALELARSGPRSRPETHLRLAILERGLPEPRIEPAVHVSGDLVLHPDLAWPRYRVAVEYEGEYHGAREQLERDVQRAEWMDAAGWTLIRVDHAALTLRGPAVLARIERALRRRGWHRDGRP